MIGIILGTRPEIIKMSPIIRYCEKNNIDHFVLHTGQHYSYEMDKIFFDMLNLPQPLYNLDVGSGTHAAQTGKIMEGIENILLEEKPEMIIVQGDTNTVLAGSLTASKLNIKVGHVEAGLRSFDRTMPEEINRVVSDHIADYLFAPTEISKKQLLKENIDANKVFVTGNTIVDAVQQNLKIASKKTNVLDGFGLSPKNYVLVTSHRAENVDSKNRLANILSGLKLVKEEFSVPIVFPIHPRTEKMIQKFGLSMEGINTIKPQGFLEFLQLEANAKIVLTDSGGIQEETCILGVPCVTLRENTERPETLNVKSNVLAGVDSSEILRCTTEMLSRNSNWENPYGDGKAAEKIVSICT
ncbi:UDP-N-acetylglucosamine 2-epimerase (non-hydrolysing) [Methanohalophilus euhalobius]|uniref:UDP-N-acetylglucosamine 2-epimerase (Non-hydrolysing) n=1 Tax=Methanohalophilus euhalobius TaxID=51203 RepID=A0A285GB45_9EURY|nr:MULTISPECIES: UDP-N-acetylglucosamine 2-epimerase (non-hydrolyzing) [Methanohalophilus]ODV48839.1 MAG: UDP-N-acetylglucosamine 2-epimerase [Methanohalophilus sp. 2-GBenrich]TCL11588.1 UDP-N-acetylglucosamine 2-epimerase (non-hydrolysing) [Methanohalophilus euhalobius]SNY20685.1 UDP-N-acetylglucosamine 2-epimerase (non-hydrolysing) [Methanohalophilus euhalobius]